RRHTSFSRDWSSGVCSSDLADSYGLSRRSGSVDVISTASGRPIAMANPSVITVAFPAGLWTLLALHGRMTTSGRNELRWWRRNGYASYDTTADLHDPGRAARGMGGQVAGSGGAAAARTRFRDRRSLARPRTQPVHL